jgi:hypothetical protein
MRKIQLAAAVAAVLFLGLASGVKAEVKMGISVGSEGLNGFYMAVSDYNRVPPQEVVTVRQFGIPDEELPVVFFMAGKAGVSRDEIIKLRLKRWGWARIVGHYKIDPAVFYVPVKEKVYGRVYGKAYGYYVNRPQNKWRNIRLSDNDVVNCVNLRFVSEHYGYAPEEVIKMREGGKNFVTIDNDIRVINKNKVKVWKKGRDQDGYDKKGYNMKGFNRDGYDKKGRDWKGNPKQEFREDDTKNNKQVNPDGPDQGKNYGDKKDNGHGWQKNAEEENNGSGWKKNDDTGYGKDKVKHGNR